MAFQTLSEKFRIIQFHERLRWSWKHPAYVERNYASAPVLSASYSTWDDGVLMVLVVATFTGRNDGPVGQENIQWRWSVVKDGYEVQENWNPKSLWELVRQLNARLKADGVPYEDRLEVAYMVSSHAPLSEGDIVH